MIKHVVSGILISALAAGTGVLASVVPASAAAEQIVMHADVDAWQVALHDGRESSDKDQSGSRKVKASVGEGFTQDAFTLSSPSSQPRSERLYGVAEYRIVSVGEQRPFWIKASLFHDGSYGPKCDVYLGAPSAGGKRVDPDSSPFTCWTKMTAETSTEFRYTFSVGLNRDAETSGAISPTDAVSLENPTYKSYGLPYSKHSEESVPAGGTTTFDTVLRVSDKPGFEKQARTEFAYQIYDNGKPTDYWVAGMSTNHRGAVFTGDSRCGIFQSNPLAGEGQFDQRVPLKASPYTCTSDWDYKTGPHESGRLHSFARFTVSPKK
jgi:hypothetical protein